MEYKDGKTALMVITYKLRHPDILDYMLNGNFDKDRYDFFIVSQENDPAKDKMKKYEDAGITVLYPDVTSIFSKRYWILEYCKAHKYKYLVQIDDDLKTEIGYITATDFTEGGSHKVMKGEGMLNKLVDKFYDTIKQYNAGMVGCAPFGRLGLIVDMDTPTYASVVSAINIMDVEKADFSNICYDPSGDLNEDTDICIKFLQEGFYVMRIKDMAWIEADNWYNAQNSVIYKSKKDLWHLQFGICKKYHLPLSITDDGKDLQLFRVPLKYFYNTHILPDIDQELLDLYDKEDYDGCVKYLNKKRKDQQINAAKAKIRKASLKHRKK